MRKQSATVKPWVLNAQDKEAWAIIALLAAGNTETADLEAKAIDLLERVRTA